MAWTRAGCWTRTETVDDDLEAELGTDPFDADTDD